MLNIYVVSALVTKPGMHGHRAVVTAGDTREEAIAYAMEQIVVDGWAVASYDCGLCDHVMKAVERDFLERQTNVQQPLKDSWWIKELQNFWGDSN